MPNTPATKADLAAALERSIVAQDEHRDEVLAGQAKVRFRFTALFVVLIITVGLAAWTFQRNADQTASLRRDIDAAQVERNHQHQDQDAQLAKIICLLEGNLNEQACP